MFCVAISILLPVYNSEKYIKDCLNSIFNQTFTNWELIIIDDGSNDTSIDIIKSLLPLFKNNVVLLQLSHHGLPYCLNYGVTYAKGEYVARIDADDIMLPTRLAKQIDFLSSNPQIGILGTNAYEINENGEPFSILTKPQFDAAIKQAFKNDCPIIHPSVMIKKALLIEYPYNENYPSPEDFELWIRLMRVTNFENLQEPLIEKRKHFAQATYFNNKLFIWRSVKLSVIYNIKNKNLVNALGSIRPLLFLLLPNNLVIWVKAKKQHKQLLKFKQSNSI